MTMCALRLARAAIASAVALPPRSCKAARTLRLRFSGPIGQFPLKIKTSEETIPHQICGSRI